MKVPNFILVCLFVLTANHQITAQPKQSKIQNDWENETVFAVNKEDGHSTFIPFADSRSMKSDPTYLYPWERTGSTGLNSLQTGRPISTSRDTTYPDGTKFRSLQTGKCSDTARLYTRT